jgi:hypothetical protein
MQTKRWYLLQFCIVIALFLLGCETDVDTPSAAGTTSKPEYKGEFEIQSQLAQTASNGALSYTLKATIPFKIAWSVENNRWKITGTDPKAQGVVTLTGNAVECTGNLTGDVEIVGYMYPEKLKPCLIKISIFQNWSDATLTCVTSFPFPITQEIPNGSAAFSSSDDFNYQATSGYHSKQVSYTNGMLTGILQMKMKSFNGSVIDGCAITY